MNYQQMKKNELIDLLKERDAKINEFESIKHPLMTVEITDDEAELRNRLNESIKLLTEMSESLFTNIALWVHSQTGLKTYETRNIKADVREKWMNKIKELVEYAKL